MKKIFYLIHHIIGEENKKYEIQSTLSKTYHNISRKISTKKNQSKLKNAILFNKANQSSKTGYHLNSTFKRALSKAKF